MKKALPLTLVLIGAALLITAVVFWINSTTSTEPQSFGKTLLDWATLIAGLGASIKGWLDLFKKEKPVSSTTKIEVKGERSQVSTGDNSPNIQTETYIGTQIVHQPPEPKTPKSLNQLPSPPLNFIGREEELLELRRNIDDGALALGIQGIGGVGKTALGLKLAEEIVSNFPDGNIYLDLRGVDDLNPLKPEQIMSHIIWSFSPETDFPRELNGLESLYRTLLHGKRVLLFYDNAFDESQLQHLLPPRGSLLLFTSRQRCALAGSKTINLETLQPEQARELVCSIVPSVENSQADKISSLCGYLPFVIQNSLSILETRPDFTLQSVIEQLPKIRLDLVQRSLQLHYSLLDDELKMRLIKLVAFGSEFSRDVIFNIWEDSSARSDDSLGRLLKTNLLLYKKSADKYYFHDLTFLFVKSLSFQDKNYQEVLARASKIHVQILKSQMYIDLAPVLRERYPTLEMLNEVSRRINAGDIEIDKNIYRRLDPIEESSTDWKNYLVFLSKLRRHITDTRAHLINCQVILEKGRLSDQIQFRFAERYSRLISELRTINLLLDSYNS